MNRIIFQTTFLTICISTFLFSCEVKKDTLFTLVDPDNSGIDFVNAVDETAELNILSYEYLYNGGGVAAGDLNHDGLVDLYFTGNQVANKLYLNKGDLEFEDVTMHANVAGKSGWKTGVTIVDINGDNRPDIYVCYSGPGSDQSRANQLFINKGGVNPTFVEMAKEYGIDAPGTFSTQASFFDYDRDGDLDMFLLNHAKITYSPFYNTKKLRNKRHPKYGNRFYRNDNGVFTDVSSTAGIHGSGINFGLGVSVSDVNRDGWPDLYVTNDYEEQDFFYLNNGDGTFKECLKESFQHISRFGMGCDVADYNNDLLPDVFVADMLPHDNYRRKLLQGPDEFDKYTLLRDSGYHHQNMRNMLQLNQGVYKNGVPVFSEIGQLSGVSDTDWSWCPLFADLDNDGWKDLVVTNGYLRDYTNLDFLKYTFEDFKKTGGKRNGMDTLALIRQMPSTKLTNYFFRNNGDLTFSDHAQTWGFTEKAISNGCVYADLDNDGDLDVVVNNINEPAFVYRNNSSGNHFLKVNLIGEGLNTTAIGAKVFITAGNRSQMQENFPTRGFQSCIPQELNFGLGDDNLIEEVLIQWPDTKITRMKNFRADTVITIHQSSAIADNIVIKKQETLFEEVSLSGVKYKHQENDFVDFKKQFLLPYQVSSNGPCIAKVDLNEDGIDDFFIGGAAGQSGQLFMSNGIGAYSSTSKPWIEDGLSEDTDALFFDADNDHDLDLYVVSGSSEFSHEQNDLLQDRLYLNDGKNNFWKTDSGLPGEKSNGSCVVVTDFDKDGDMDIFIGGKSLPGYYPLPAYCHLLRNDSKGSDIRFSDITPLSLRKTGIINTALWFDHNNDGWEDLVIAGDMTPILIYENRNGSIRNETPLAIPNSSGFWSKLVSADVDSDGDQDIIAGNVGQNLKFRVSVNEPVTIHYHDFNEDGNIDPILSYYVQGKSCVYPSRDEILDQLPYLRKRFVKYDDYAKSDLGEILSADNISKAKVLRAETFQTSLLKNEGGKFELIPFSIPVQFSKINGINVNDYDNDGIKDILFAGNFYPYRVELGRNDAGYGLIMKGKTDGSFSAITPGQSGFFASGDVRSMIELKHNKDRYILLGTNNDSLKIYKVKHL